MMDVHSEINISRCFNAVLTVQQHCIVLDEGPIERCDNAVTTVLQCCVHYIPLPGMQSDVGTINTEGIQLISNCGGFFRILFYLIRFC